MYDTCATIIIYPRLSGSGCKLGRYRSPRGVGRYHMLWNVTGKGNMYAV